MKFKGEPGSVIIDGKTHKAIGRFDKNGIFEITIPEYIDRMKLHFPVVEETEEKKRTCKTCGKEFDTQGELLKHYKDEHPKE